MGRNGVDYTNYELWDGNIYGSSRQRTAIGYDSGTFGYNTSRTVASTVGFFER